MIDFACKEFELDAVIKCGLNLTKAELLVMKYFLKREEGWLTTEKVSQDLEMNQSTVQRAVKKLHEKDILTRSQQNLDRGGYVFVHRIRSRKQIQQVMMETVRRWVDRLEKELAKWAEEEQK